MLLLHPGAPSKRLGIAFTVMTSGTFPFPSNQKMPRDYRFKPELTIAGLTPKLTILTNQCHSQELCKQIHLSNMPPSSFSFFPQADNHSIRDIPCQSGQGMLKGKQFSEDIYISACKPVNKHRNSSSTVVFTRFHILRFLTSKLHHKSDTSYSETLQFFSSGSISSLSTVVGVLVRQCSKTVMVPFS